MYHYDRVRAQNGLWWAFLKGIYCGMISITWRRVVVGTERALDTRNGVDREDNEPCCSWCHCLISTRPKAWPGQRAETKRAFYLRFKIGC
jgi:hypothetical protein